MYKCKCPTRNSYAVNIDENHRVNKQQGFFEHAPGKNYQAQAQTFYAMK
jgi:hypothetical protein